MPNATLVTGANGEIGRSLLRALAREAARDVVALDVAPLTDEVRSLVAAAYAGDVLDREALDRIAARHEVDTVFHLAALLSARGEQDPELAHRVNVEGTLAVLHVARTRSRRLGRPVRLLFPSSIAVYGLPSAAAKHAAGPVREEAWNAPVTMYGCNKLYCEHLGRYFTLHARPAGAPAGEALVDFRALRFPGLMSADTVPSGGTSDFGPEMIHAAARGAPYECFVEPDARLPFMAMPDAVRALVELARADRAALTSCVYNVRAFSVTAGEIAERVRGVFPGARVDYRPDPARAKVVASWPEDVDDARARADWGWRPEYDWAAAFETYLVPGVRARYGA